MMTHAGYWDHYLDLVRETQRPWAEAADDTDDYRKGRAVKLFNLGARSPSPSRSSLPSSPLPR